MAASSLPIHEVGRNGDVFPEDAGKFLPAGGFINWATCTSTPAASPGSDGATRDDHRLPAASRGLQAEATRSFGPARQLQVAAIRPTTSDDAYFVAPQAMKIVNYEPHMHANGVRMCLQAIIGRAVETLNCSGYDHNWVRNYYYQENYQPLIPKGRSSTPSRGSTTPRRTPTCRTRGTWRPSGTAR